MKKIYKYYFIFLNLTLELGLGIVNPNPNPMVRLLNFLKGLNFKKIITLNLFILQRIFTKNYMKKSWTILHQDFT